MPLSFSRPWVTGTQGADTCSAHWQLARPGGRSGIYPQSRPPSPAVSLCLPGHILSGAGSAGVPCWAPVTGHPVPTPCQRSLQGPFPAPAPSSRKAEQPQPQDLCTCSAAVAPAPWPPDPICLYFCLLLSQSRVAQAVLELMIPVPPPVLTGGMVYMFLDATPALFPLIPSPDPSSLFVMLRRKR